MSGAVVGPQDATRPVSFALDGNVRFLSVFLAGASSVLLWCLPRVERAKVPLRVVCAMVFLGGCACLLSIAAVGAPDTLFCRRDLRRARGARAHSGATGTDRTGRSGAAE